MRLFISINFNDLTTEKIQHIQDEMMYLSRGNYTSKMNLHLTLAFLGEIEEERIPEIKEAMDAVSFEPMQLWFTELGCFRRDSELWWIGIKKNQQLLELQSKLSEELKARGFKLESRKFIPHITLARQTLIPDEKIKRLLKKPFSTTVSEISLMISHRPNGKLMYTQLYSVNRK